MGPNMLQIQHQYAGKNEMTYHIPLIALRERFHAERLTTPLASEDIAVPFGNWW